MTTSLGGAMQAGIKLMVKNGTPVLIKRGTVVTWNSVAAGNPAVVFLDLEQKKDYGAGTVRQLEIPMIRVDVTEATESATGGARGRLGVLTADLAPNGFGEIMVFGICQVIVGLGMTAGDVITSILGTATDAANATDKNPIGIALETGAPGEVKYAFINCLNWAGAGTAFGGKAY